jgi:hypothetical protein
MTSERRPARVLNPVPRDIREALVQRGLLDAYAARPPYQRGEYVAWIESSPIEWTRQKRLNQMLAELEQGGIYMKMARRPL